MIDKAADVRRGATRPSFARVARKQVMSMCGIAAALSVPLAAVFIAAPSAASPARGCAVDRPCILAVYNVRANLVVEWNDTEKRDHYNVRWSRPGRSEAQVERPGGTGGSFTLKNFNSNTRYTFKVQGCKKPLIGRSTCTPWYEETITSCGSRANPCR